MCVTHGHRQQHDDGHRAVGWGLGGAGQRRRNGDICNGVNNKNIEKFQSDLNILQNFSVLHGISSWVYSFNKNCTSANYAQSCHWVLEYRYEQVWPSPVFMKITILFQHVLYHTRFLLVLEFMKQLCTMAGLMIIQWIQNPKKVSIITSNINYFLIFLNNSIYSAD